MNHGFELHLHAYIGVGDIGNGSVLIGTVHMSLALWMHGDGVLGRVVEGCVSAYYSSEIAYSICLAQLLYLSSLLQRHGCVMKCVQQVDERSARAQLVQLHKVIIIYFIFEFSRYIPLLRH